jgi:hypothetical protein
MRCLLLLCALLVLVAAPPARASDIVPGLAVEEIVEAGPGGSVTHPFGSPFRVRGVYEFRTVTRAPALIPLTSSRAGHVAVRRWGETLPEEARPLAMGTQPQMPYLANWGTSLDPVRMSAPGSSVVSAWGEMRGQPRSTGLSPADDPYAYEFPGGLSPEQVEALTTVFGAPEEMSVGALRLGAAYVRVWWPHAAVVVAAALTVTAFVRRRRAR